MEYLLYLIGFVAIVAFVLDGVFFGTKSIEEKEREKQLEKSLDDERIYDPETGQLITLEQAQSGKWEASDRPIISEDKIEKYYNDRDKEMVHIFNYLNASSLYEPLHVNSEISTILKNLNLLKNYDGWQHHSVSYRLEKKGVLLFPVVIHGEFLEPYILFGMSIPHQTGHYVFREKHAIEKWLDLIDSDDDFEIDGYECFTLSPTNDEALVTQILSAFEDTELIEIELVGSWLFVKSAKPATLVEVQDIEDILFR